MAAVRIILSSFKFLEFAGITGNAIAHKEMHIDILRRLRDKVSTKRPEKWTANISFLLHDNALSHLSVLVKDFLTKNNLTIMQHPPYSPDQAPADSYLFR